MRSLRTAFDDGIRHLDTSPTYVTVDTFEVAKIAVSAVLTSVDEVFEDRHANQHRALGFCLIGCIRLIRCAQECAQNNKPSRRGGFVKLLCDNGEGGIRRGAERARASERPEASGRASAGALCPSTLEGRKTLPVFEFPRGFCA